MTALAARFNRAPQKDFVEKGEELMWAGRPQFSRRLRDYPGRRNRKRPRRDLEPRPPLAALNEAGPRRPACRGAMRGAAL